MKYEFKCRIRSKIYLKYLISLLQTFADLLNKILKFYIFERTLKKI